MVREAVAQCRESVRGLAVEHAWVIQRDGAVLHGSGDAGSVSLAGADLDGAVVVHNHPLVDGEPMSFGHDDFVVLRGNPGIRKMYAASGPYEYEVVVLKAIDISYNEAYRNGGDFTGDRDGQHSIMRWLDHEGYVRYRRKNVQADA